MANNKKSSLGRGLGALFSEPPETILEEIEKGPSSEAVSEISISDIEPNKNQPRKSFDTEKLQALSESIKEHGVVTPILINPTKNGTYKIVAGERRWRAAKLAGIKSIPCVIKELDEQTASEIAMVENLQRDDLNPIEEAEGYKFLMDKYSMTQDEVSQKIGRSRSAIANALRLNNLCDTVKEYVKNGSLSQGHARTLITLEEGLQKEVAEKIISSELSVRQTEALVKNLGQKPKEKSSKSKNPITEKYYKEIESNLSSRFGTKVKISEGNKKGKIEIEYYTKDDLERILFELKR